MVSPQLTVKLAQILEAYISFGELSELADVFGVSLFGIEQRWLAAAKELTENLNQGNTRILVDNLVDLCETRNVAGIAHATFERRDLHYAMSPKIQEAKDLLATSSAPSEITVPAGNPFTAKSKVRELLETSTGDVFLVDPYIGVGTLDCLRGLAFPIRLLTANHSQAIEPNFGQSLAAFVTEGHVISVRTSAGLHDRHLMFNDRCWIVGGSLKDAGRKPFNCIEIADKTAVVSDLETRWLGGIALP